MSHIGIGACRDPGTQAALFAGTEHELSRQAERPETRLHVPMRFGHEEKEASLEAEKRSQRHDGEPACCHTLAAQRTDNVFDCESTRLAAGGG